MHAILAPTKYEFILSEYFHLMSTVLLPFDQRPCIILLQFLHYLRVQCSTCMGGHWGQKGFKCTERFQNNEKVSFFLYTKVSNIHKGL